MAASVGAQSLERITPGQEWPDRKGEHINAHGGGLLFHEGMAITGLHAGLPPKWA